MKQAGQIVLFRFPRTDGGAAKPRPALMVARVPGPYDDWLTCMISTQLGHAVPAFDEVVDMTDPDYASSGLRSPSVIRVGRLAVVDGAALLGSTGEIGPERLDRIKARLRSWLA